jgi:3-keto-5-aminohexanoate cleavage enzyme
MEKLIITVAVDSNTSYPNNPLCPSLDQVDEIGRNYIEGIKAGASVAHIHGMRVLEEKIQPDGRQVSKIYHERWKELKEIIQSEVDPIIQYGVASARVDDKVKLMKQGPEMMSVCFNAHDEYFQPDPAYPPKRMMAIHPVEELIEYAETANEHGVKLEIECFHTGAFWNIDFVRRTDKNLLPDPLWLTLFFGWPGGTWTPPSEKALIYTVDHLPENCNWSVSIMNPEMQWRLVALAISLGGHVRVGWEDNPYLDHNKLGTISQLVGKAVDLAHKLGREIASPEEARKIIGLRSKS